MGTDVSKETRDVMLLQDSNWYYQKQFTNDSKDYKQLLGWLETYLELNFENALFCMERTGHYTESDRNFRNDENHVEKMTIIIETIFKPQYI